MSVDFDRVSKLFGIISGCRDYPQFRALQKQAMDELKDIDSNIEEDYVPVNKRPGATLPGQPTGMQPRAIKASAIDEESVHADTSLAKPTLNKRV